MLPYAIISINTDTMKIVFVQLPLLDHGLHYIAGNMPNAPAMLHAFCHIHHGNTVTALQLPQHIQNFGSDTVITNFLLESEPTHIAFTCYLWNVERSLAIAQKIKALTPTITIIFGGPEIQLSSYILSHYHPEVDLFVIGEGEFFFDYFVDDTHKKFIYTINGNMVFIQPANLFIPLSKMVEPYTAGYLLPMYDNTISVEIIRGCPFKCNYCLYSKNAHSVRAFSSETLATIIKKAKNDNLKEIYLLAPTFNQSVHFKDYLSTLIQHENSIPLHTELRADTITKDIALTLKKANFHSVEVGLQTLNHQCLRKIGRKTNPQKELDGILLLKECALTLQIGIIPGLPYDTPQSFYSTIDTLLDLGLGNEIELYPLMVLPGTELYDTAQKQNAVFMEKPPYYFIEGFHFSQNDLQSINHYFEETTGFVFNPPFIPSFIFHTEGSLTGSVYINLQKNTDIPLTVFEYVQTNHFTFFLQSDSSTQLHHAVHIIVNQCSDTLVYSIVLIHNHILDDQAIGTPILTKFQDTFYSRLMYFSDLYDRLPVRIFQLFNALTPFLEALKQYHCINPMLKVTQHNIDSLQKKKFAYPFPVVIARGLSPRCIKWIKEKYADSIELLSFEDEADQKYVYEALGIEYSKVMDYKTIIL